MKLNRSALVLTFLWCWFMGITAISIGFGAVFPSMNRIARPFVCPRGSMDLETQTYHPYPGSTITTLTWYCVDNASDERKELGIFPMSLYAGTIYGLILFIVVFLFMFILSTRSPNAEPQTRYDRLAKANALLERAKQDRAEAEEFRKQAEQFRDAMAALGQQDADASSRSDTLERMKELKKLREANLISEKEYEEKRHEILKSL
jgi:uncharacterized membrane protein